jgi:hypothetical protein
MQDATYNTQHKACNTQHTQVVRGSLEIEGTAFHRMQFNGFCAELHKMREYLVCERACVRACVYVCWDAVKSAALGFDRSIAERAHSTWHAISCSLRDVHIARHDQVLNYIAVVKIVKKRNKWITTRLAGLLVCACVCVHVCVCVCVCVFVRACVSCVRV